MLLDELESPEVWLRFLRYKQESGHMRQQELQALEEFVTQKRYRPVVARIREGQPFPLPKRTELSKLHSQKKRIVYTYPEDENRVLKLLTWLLLEKYDSIFADNVYSFRPRKGVRDGVCSLVYAGNVGRLWSYKVDISNYFNSVPVDRLLPVLEETLADDPQTFTFLKGLLCEPMVLSGHTPIAEQKGIMAGTPISTFLANLYLKDMDLWFQNAGVLYARYADDIILFAPSQEQRDTLRDQLRQFLWEKGLSVNPDKEALTGPGEQWVYLGISCQGRVVDVAPVSVEKLKGKMRRKTRALQRWQARTGATGPQTAKAFIRAFNRKLFDNPLAHELTWARWYFPLITTTASLQQIDHYAQQCIRTLATGSHTKSAYQFRYEDMKALGYISLVNQYYKHRATP